ncbi:MAG: acyl-CoA dehydrogenase family protein [Desulfobacterales bacterium]|jgi:acyl-CoA dehydrogenase|nr:acyl-CoA dehydrogenase family protein [Desulfobacterales bacterium]
MRPSQKELNLVVDSVRRFAKKEIEGNVEAWEKMKNVPRELYKKMGDVGFLGSDLPEVYGGEGTSYHYTAAVASELARLGHFAHGALIISQMNLLSHYLYELGNEEQKQKYLIPMIKGECIPTICLTEPSGGSDLQAVKTEARKDGDYYILNGSKTFISVIHIADLHIVVARTNPLVSGARGLTLFIVDKGTEGLALGPNLEKIGFKACGTGDVYFDDVKVHKRQVLGEIDKGFIHLMNLLPLERILLATQNVGLIEGALQWTVDYVKKREVFGSKLSELQNTRFKIAEMVTEFNVLRGFCDHCMDLMDKGKLTAEIAAMLKLFGSDVAFKITDECLQFFGGSGYMAENPISRAWANARLSRIYGGTSEIMKHIIAKNVLD